MLWLIWQIVHWIELSFSTWVIYPIPSSFVIGHGTYGKAWCTEGWEEVRVLCSGASCRQTPQLESTGWEEDRMA